MCSPRELLSSLISIECTFASYGCFFEDSEYVRGIDVFLSFV
jgi:hypothetical protein